MSLPRPSLIFHCIYPSISCPDHPVRSPPLPQRCGRCAEEWHTQIYLIGWKIGMRQGSFPQMFSSPTSQPLPPPLFNLFSFFYWRILWLLLLSTLRVSLSDSHDDHLRPCLFLWDSTVPCQQAPSLFRPTSLPISPCSSFLNIIIIITSCGDAPHQTTLK